MIQSSAHKCNWVGCDKIVPARLWGCSEHWFMLPARIRSSIFRYYVPGQEKDLSKVTDSYTNAYNQAKNWILANHKAANQ